MDGARRRDNRALFVVGGTRAPPFCLPTDTRPRRHAAMAGDRGALAPPIRSAQPELEPNCPVLDVTHLETPGHPTPGCRPVLDSPGAESEEPLTGGRLAIAFSAVSTAWAGDEPAASSSAAVVDSPCWASALTR